MTKRIYHIHVRKTAGTSLNMAFWMLGGLETLETREMSHSGLVANGLKFVGHNPALIEAGDFFYATSHFPIWWVNVPRDAFTITILREPSSRVISYFRYLLWSKENRGRTDLDPYVESVAREGQFIDGGPRHSRQLISVNSLRFERSAIRALGSGQYLRRLDPRRRESLFRDFLARVPPHHLWTQLHMFSKRFDPAEAAEKVLATSAVCFTETFSDDLQRLSERLGLDLRPRHERRLGDEIELTHAERELLREKMAPEYEMVEFVREGLRSSPSLLRPGPSMSATAYG